MLFLIGLGLDKGDISARALAQLKKCNKILLDPYTNRVSDDYIKYIEEETGKKVEPLTRSDLEEKAKETIKAAKDEDIAIIVSGDPLIATTHHTTLLDLAVSEGIKAKVFHASSIFSAAIGISGLDIYKFGPTTTIPFWSERYKPTSFIDVIKKNIENGEHTLVLLDYDYKNERGMSLQEAFDLLEKARSAKGVKLEKILVLGDIGKESEEIAYGNMQSLMGISGRFDGKVLSLIIPSHLNFSEEEALSKYAISST